MATKIRLKRFGGRHDPHYRIVVADSRKQRDGRAIEELGYYSTAGSAPQLEVNAERVEYWLGVGAIPTDTVKSLLTRAGVVEGPDCESAETASDEAETEDAEQTAQADAEAAEDADETE